MSIEVVSGYKIWAESGSTQMRRIFNGMKKEVAKEGKVYIQLSHTKVSGDGNESQSNKFKFCL